MYHLLFSEKSYSLTTSDSLEDYSSSSDQKDSPPLIQIEQATSDEQHIDPLHQNSVITFQQSTERYNMQLGIQYNVKLLY